MPAVPAMLKGSKFARAAKSEKKGADTTDLASAVHKASTER
jgi:hypothetical protein